jgi:hypothetical protein
MLCQQPRNGYIDTALSFPVEDLYVGGDMAGQVGQEIYGAGTAFVFATRAFHRIDDAPFDLFCDLFLLGSDRTSDRSLTLQLCGDPAGVARLSLLPKNGGRLGRVKVVAEPGGTLQPVTRDERREVEVAANARVHLRWG